MWHCAASNSRAGRDTYYYVVVPCLFLLRMTFCLARYHENAVAVVPASKSNMVQCKDGMTSTDNARLAAKSYYFKSATARPPIHEHFRLESIPPCSGRLSTSSKHLVCIVSLLPLDSYQRIFIAPLRNSDRRKLKQRILEDFGLSNFQGPEQNDGVDVGDLLVPDGLQSVKFTTHAGEIGVRYPTDIVKRCSWRIYTCRLHTSRLMAIHSGSRLGRAMQI